MGEPVDGTLFYGYCWREEIPFDEYHENNDLSALVREANNQCEVGWYGVDGHEATFVYIIGTDTTAGQFNPKPVDVGHVFTSDAANRRWWAAMLDTFLADNCVEPPTGENQPGWWLVSRYVS
jgi:hypothetical protein